MLTVYPICTKGLFGYQFPYFRCTAFSKSVLERYFTPTHYVKIWKH
jgi:hypothetical protein